MWKKKGKKMCKKIFKRCKNPCKVFVQKICKKMWEKNGQKNVQKNAVIFKGCIMYTHVSKAFVHGPHNIIKYKTVFSTR